MKIYYISILSLLLFCLSSCIVKAPRYSRVEKVMGLKMGLTPDEVTQCLGTIPYNLVLLTDTEYVVLYKYRVTDRAIVPFFMKENNGREVRGKYVNLLVTFGKNGLVKKYQSCADCDVTTIERKQIDVNRVITFLTITLPIALVFLGIKIGLK